MSSPLGKAQPREHHRLDGQAGYADPPARVVLINAVQRRLGIRWHPIPYSPKGVEQKFSEVCAIRCLVQSPTCLAVPCSSNPDWELGFSSFSTAPLSHTAPTRMRTHTMPFTAKLPSAAPTPLVPLLLAHATAAPESGQAEGGAPRAPPPFLPSGRDLRSAAAT
jgi:hypothetical protein